MAKAHTLKAVEYTDLAQSRYIRVKKLGYTPDDLAKEEGVSVETINKSIARYEVAKSLRSMEQVAEGQASIVAAVNHLETKAIAGALEAQTFAYDAYGKPVKDGKGNPITVPDHEIRLRAVDTVNKKIEAIQPKSRGGVNVAVGVGVNATPVGGQTAPRFEDRLRILKEKRLMLNAPPVEEGNVIDAAASPEGIDDQAP